jgi:internalin A
MASLTPRGGGGRSGVRPWHPEAMPPAFTVKSEHTMRYSHIAAFTVGLVLITAPTLMARDDSKAKEAAIARIKELGGSIEVDDHSPGKPVIKVNLRATKATDADLIILKALSGLQDLRLGRTGLTDAGMEHLKDLTDLKCLVISHTKISDAGLARLKDLTNLQRLDIGGTNVTDAGLKQLRGLTNLRDLNLCLCTLVTDGGLEHLKGLTKLEELDLDSAQVTDAGLKQLVGLINLEVLHLGDTKVTAAGVQELQKALATTKINR